MNNIIPTQCEKCIQLELCKKLNCIKSDCCIHRLEPVHLDPDFVQEMRERMGI